MSLVTVGKYSMGVNSCGNGHPDHYVVDFILLVQTLLLKVPSDPYKSLPTLAHTPDDNTSPLQRHGGVREKSH